MYHSGIDRNKTHELHQEVSPGNFHSQNLSNGLISFADHVEGYTSNNKCIIECVILCIFRIAVHWLAKTQPDSASHSTYYKVLILYLAKKMVQWIWPILQNLGLLVFDDPTNIYKDSQPKIDIIK